MGGGDGEMLQREKVGFPFLLTLGTYSISFTLSFSVTLVLIMRPPLLKVEVKNNTHIPAHAFLHASLKHLFLATPKKY